MAALWLIVRILLWVLAILLGLVVLALFVPVTAELQADEKGFAAWLRVLFVRVRLYPRPPKKENRPRREKRKKAKSAPAQKAEPPAPEKAQGQPPENGPQPARAVPDKGEVGAKGESAAGAPARKKSAPERPKRTAGGSGASLADRLPKDMDRIAALVSTAGGAVRRLLAGLTAHGIKAFLPVHRDDAAGTALAVGGVWAAVGASLGVLQNFLRIRPGEITVQPDYTGEEQRKASFSCKITGYLFIMVLVGIWAFRRLKEQKIL